MWRKYELLCKKIDGGQHIREYDPCHRERLWRANWIRPDQLDVRRSRARAEPGPELEEPLGHVVRERFSFLGVRSSNECLNAVQRRRRAAAASCLDAGAR